MASVLGAAVAGQPGPDDVKGFSIDTRTLVPGDVFVAIKGERTDGHRYLLDAAHKGAAAAIVSEEATARERVPDMALVMVRDTVEALQTLAREVRRRSGASIVAVTGSAGKSTTKEITAAFLAARYTVIRNRGNLNNHIGLPLSLLELRSRPQIGVFELGMNHAGEISTLVGIAEPDVRVWTNVGPAHLEFFGTVEAIADAKAEIMEGAGKDDLLVANGDDDLVMGRARRFAGRLCTFAVERPADVRALAVDDLGIDGTKALVRTPIGDVQITTPLPGAANLMNVLAATAVAVRFDVPLSDIAERAAALTPVARRGQIVRTSGLTIIDDSYNSNPRALSRALAMLAHETRFARRIAVVGEMLELGEASAGLHESLGAEAASAQLAELIAVGGDSARALADGAVAAGMPVGRVHYVATSVEAADLAARLVRAGDLVLVKGSRGIRTELVADRLKAEER